MLKTINTKIDKTENKTKGNVRAMNTYTVTIIKEIIYKTEIHADNWEDAWHMAECEFEKDERAFEEVEQMWEVVDYALTAGEENACWLEA